MDALAGEETDPGKLLQAFGNGAMEGLKSSAITASLTAVRNLGCLAPKLAMLSSLALVGLSGKSTFEALQGAVDSLLAGNYKQALFRALGFGLSAYGTYKASAAAFDTMTGVVNGSKCFVAGTLVLTEDGEKPIEEIEVGDYVYASDPETGDSDYKEVLQTFVNETSELVHIHINGDEIASTPTHPFYSPVRGWTSAVDLKAGDILVLSNGEYVIVEQVQHEILESPVKVYNFEVQDFHTYYVGKNSVLVHNYCPTDKNNNNSKRSKPVNRASPKKVTIDMEEVLSGHTSNGYRAKQSNIKDLFPDSMSEKQIKNEIIEAYKNAKQVGKPQYDYDSSRIKLQGKGFNGYVEMWYNVTTKTIETAYPIYGKKVRIN